MQEWRVYKNANRAPKEIGEWSVPAPPWRGFFDLPEERLIAADPPPEEFPRDFFYWAKDPRDLIINTVNAAIRLRRPILVSGKPGTGKTSLAYSIAYELGLGPVLTWLITSRSTLREGLYEYDVLGRINDMNLADRLAALAAAAGSRSEDRAEGPAARTLSDAEAVRDDARDIGRYITLGPLGDALLPRKRPRVLLIDEIDKCDIDLPGDLLHVFERGWYEIPELVRERQDEVTVQRAGGLTAVVRGGRVQCHEFPVIVLTSNEQREFPPEFRRRCLQLELALPGDDNLTEIASKKLRADVGQPATGEEVAYFTQARGPEGTLATDQLLNALFLRLPEHGLEETDFQKVREIVYARLSGSGEDG